MRGKGHFQCRDRRRPVILNRAGFIKRESFEQSLEGGERFSYRGTEVQTLFSDFRHKCVYLFFWPMVI